MTNSFKREELLKRLRRALDGINKAGRGDDGEAQDLKAIIEALEGSPDEVMEDRNFLESIWHTLTSLVKWVWAVCKGFLQWVVEVMKSAVQFVEQALHGLTLCFE